MSVACFGRSSASVLSLPRLALVFGLAAAVPSAASTLTVQSAVTHSGDWAARVDVSTCPIDHRTIANGTDYVGTVTEEACISISAGDVDVLAGADVSFVAGERIVLGSGFSVASGASFRATVTPSSGGSAFVESSHPASEAEVWFRFYVYPDDLSLGAGGFRHFAGYGTGGELELAVGLKRNAALAENRVFVEAVEDGGGTVSTEGAQELVLPDGWHRIELRWNASSGADDGSVEICVDDSPGGGAMCVELTGLDTDPIDSVRWGAVEVPAGDFGTLYMDDFRAVEGGPIGGCESEQACP